MRTLHGIQGSTQAVHIHRQATGLASHRNVNHSPAPRNQNVRATYVDAPRRLCKPSFARSAATSSYASSIDTEPVSDDAILQNILAGRVGEAAHQCTARLQLRSPPDINVCVNLIRGLLQADKYRAAWQIYRELCELNINLNYSTHHMLIVSALKAQQQHDVVSLVQHMERTGLVLNEATLVVIINGLLKSRKKGVPFQSVAWRLWKRLRDRGGIRHAATFSTGIHACVSMGKFKEAESLLSQMSEAGIHPSTLTYNVLMKGYCHRGDAASARTVFKRMKAAGLQPDVVTYNVLMHCFVRRGELLRAKAVFDKAMREGVKPDAWTYTIYMQALCKAGDVEAAEKVMRTMQEEGKHPTKVTFGILINGYVKQGRLADAERLLNHMQTKGPPPTTIIYNSIIAAHVGTLTSEGFTTALKMLRTMSALGIPPEADTFNIIMDALVRLPDLKGAARVFTQLSELDVPVDATLYTTLMKIFKASGQVDVVLKVFAEMSSSPEAEADSEAWSSLADALACAGRMQEARQAAEQAAKFAMERGRPPPVSAFGALVNGYHQSNDMTGAVAVLREFLKMDGQADKMMYDQVIDLCLRNGDMKTAFQIVRAMELAGAPVDKAQYKAWFDKYHNPVGSLPSGPPSSRGLAAGRGSNFLNPYLERFKFWLGLPNKYYDSGAWP